MVALGDKGGNTKSVCNLKNPMRHQWIVIDHTIRGKPSKCHRFVQGQFSLHTSPTLMAQGKEQQVLKISTKYKKCSYFMKSTKRLKQRAQANQN